MRRRDVGDRAPLSERASVAFSSQLRVAALLALERRGMSASELADELGCSRQAARSALVSLASVGLVCEVGREAVSGGERLVFQTQRAGWAELVESISRFVDDA